MAAPLRAAEEGGAVIMAQIFLLLAGAFKRLAIWRKDEPEVRDGALIGLILCLALAGAVLLQSFK